MKAYKYSWTKPYGVDAQVIGEWMQRQRVKTAESLVESARDPSCPAHSLFQWDDTVAAQEYRLVQARILKSSLRVEVVSKEGKPEQVIAFINVGTRGRYVPTLEATADDLTEAEQTCWRYMQSFREKFKNLQFARTVVAAIEEVDRSVRRRKRKVA